MDLKELELLVRSYERKKKELDPFRFTAGVERVSQYPDVFGMNFEGMMACETAEEQRAFFLRQEARAQLVRQILAGEKIETKDLYAAFGIDLQELEAYKKELNPIKKEIPARLVVLCFDDALRDQYEYALPLLREYKFGASFFIAQKGASPMGPDFSDKSVYMTWNQIKEIENEGFELGNHSKHHVFGAHEKGYAFNLDEFRMMEDDMLQKGLKRPVSCAYPSGICNKDTYQAAVDMGYLWGRGNNESGSYGMRGMTYYDPLFDSPLSMCNFGDPDFYTEELLRERIMNAGEGQILGLTYHAVSPEHWLGPILFQRHMEILKEMDCIVIPMCGLEAYIDPRKALAYTEPFQ